MTVYTDATAQRWVENSAHRYVRRENAPLLTIYSPTTVGSRSTNTARGTCLPAPVSLKKVLKESSPPPMVLSDGICPSGWIPCSRQYSSQQALPICTPACPTWIDMHSRCKRENILRGFVRKCCPLPFFRFFGGRKRAWIVAKPAQPRNGGFARPKNDCAILARRFLSAAPCGNHHLTDRICPYMGQGEYPLTLFIDPQRIGCAKYGQKHLHAKVIR